MLALQVHACHANSADKDLCAMEDAGFLTFKEVTTDRHPSGLVHAATAARPETPYMRFERRMLQVG